MKLRNLAGTRPLGVGAIAALNTGLRYEGELESPLDGDDGTFRWRGMNVAYTEAGDPDDPDLVLLHGVNAAGSAGEWREVFDDLAAEHHVFAPDLPGFGRSIVPPLRYSAALYEDFVRDFLADFDEPAVVASSLSAARARPRRSRRDRLRTASRSEGSSASVRRPSPDRARRSRGSGS